MDIEAVCPQDMEKLLKHFAKEVLGKKLAHHTGWEELKDGCGEEPLSTLL